MDFIKDDGGRKEAGFKGSTGDCVVRAIAIATGGDYKAIYDELHQAAKNFEPCQRKTKKHLAHVEAIRANPSPRTGVDLLVSDAFLEARNYTSVKKSCLLNDELFSTGTFIVYTRKRYSY